jgi:hypothetical protein
MATRSGYSRQRLNKLVDLGLAHGVRRTPSGRLEVFDEKLAAQWCDSLRSRKSHRRQRNLNRIEVRQRIIKKRSKNKELQMVLDMGPLSLNAVASEYARGFNSFALSKGREFSAELVAEIARERAKEFLQPITLIQKQLFVDRARNERMRSARAMLFEYLINPGSVPHIKSSADIARDFGCTRAALSAAAKHLPAAFRKSRR